MIAKMLGNKVTTAIGVVMALLFTLQGSGLIPPEYSPYLATVTGLLTALGFTAAKDGSTGSPPGSRF